MVQSPARGTVGLRKNECDFMPCADKGCQHSLCERWRAGED